MAGKISQIKQSFRSISFILIFSVLIILIPVNCWNIYSAQQSQEVIINQTLSSIDHLANIYMKNLEHRIKSVNNYCYELVGATGDLFMLAQTTDDSGYLTNATYLAGETREHISNYEDADAFFMYLPRVKRGFVRGMATMSDYMKVMQDYFTDASNLVTRNNWNIVEIGCVRWLIHINFWYDTYFGGCINLDKIVSDIQTGLTYDTLTVSIDADSKNSDVSDRIQVTRRCGLQNLYLHISVANSEVVEKLPLIQRYSLTIALFTLLAAPAILLLLQRFVLRPLRNVVRALNQLKADPDMRIGGHASTREFEEVYHSFNDMAGEIVKLKIDNYEQLLDKQRLEITNLRLQMNPHFLMNTFNLIFHLAQMKEYQNIQMMVLYLSDYFRYITAQDRDFTTVDEEMALIHKYLEVAGIQYINRFEVDFDIDPALKTFKIPPLLLHNFVENFMKHGVVLKRLNHLKIQGRLAESMAEFIITDDGRGMPREQAERINAGIFEYKDKKDHLGLRNASRRIQYIYQGKGSMHLESDVDQGVTVCIRLPLDTAGLEISRSLTDPEVSEVE